MIREAIIYIWTLSKGYRTRICSLMFLGIVDVLIALFIVAQTKRIVDVASGVADGVIWNELMLLAGSMLVSLAIREIVFLRTTVTRNRFRNELHSRYFNLILRADWRSAKELHSGDVMSLMDKDVDEIVSLWVATLPYSVLTIVRLGGALIFLYLMEAKLAVILAVFVPVVLLTSKLYVRRMRDISRVVKARWSSIHKFLQESIQQTDVLKAFGYENNAGLALGGRQNEYMREVLKQNRLSLYSHLVIMTGFTVGYLLTFSWGVFSLESGLITFGTVMAMLQLVSMIQGPALGLVQSVPSFISSFTSQERLQTIETLPQERCDKKNGQRNISRLTLENVAFSYNENETLLENINWSFEKGKIYALTGRTGRGKTTIIRLLLAFVKPIGGRIYTVSGDKKTEVDDTTRANFSYVPQESTLFSGTIRDNVKTGRTDASDEDIEKALKAASAHFVFDLPGGLDTSINERGGGLSGGQIQRLAIARALLSDARILLLDEFSSALDADTERQIMTDLKNNVNDRIIILISHRPAVVDSCDHVCQL